ncbi:NUDIX hydrolase [Litoribacter populi]|uniref:NUDIX hydrolase n=1 Tax=Litoribacter populi TaxID=2598460 RepID=UPI00117E0415|nr:NUDIX domain-containing protein [Litoribacter populi]
MKVIDKLAWIHIQDQRLLSTRSTGKEVYYILGGKRESGESDAEALIREIQEELSVQLVKDSLHHIGTFKAQAHGHPQGVMVQMTCYAAYYTGKLQAAAEIEEIVWLSYADKEKVSPVDKIIFDWLKEERRIR